MTPTPDPERENQHKELVIKLRIKAQDICKIGRGQNELIECLTNHFLEYENRLAKQETERIRIQEGFVRPLSNDNQDLKQQIASLEAEISELNNKNIDLAVLLNGDSLKIIMDLNKLQSENAALREALENIQWGSCDGCGGDGYCPECQESSTEWVEEKDEYIPNVHKKNCSIGKALSPHPSKSGSEEKKE